MPVFALQSDFPFFPDPHQADRSGLIAIGGKLEPDWLIEAYTVGIFPWFNNDDPIMWWSPSPRAVVVPGEVKKPKSMNYVFRDNVFELKIDHSFDEVIENCKSVHRKGQDGTWITDDIQNAYIQMFDLGFAHSFETWQNDELVGGLYGLSLGTFFFGESMFSKVSDSSKFAFISMSEILKINGFSMIDCQIPNPYLESMGCKKMSRKKYLELLWKNDISATITGNWGEKLQLQ